MEGWKGSGKDRRSSKTYFDACVRRLFGLYHRADERRCLSVTLAETWHQGRQLSMGLETPGNNGASGGSLRP